MNGAFKENTIFPDSWTNEDIIDAIIEAAETGDINGNIFQKNGITKHGISIDIKGELEDGTNLIKTGYINNDFFN